MVSISQPMSSGSASSYFSRDDYYTSAPGEWFGKTAEALGLQPGSPINKADFQKLAEGRDLAGNQIVGSGGEQREHRAGTDMTFSASKSVTVLSLSDERVITAHDQAVKSSLEMYQSEFAQIRETVDGKTQKEIGRAHV